MYFSLWLIVRVYLSQNFGICRKTLRWFFKHLEFSFHVLNVKLYFGCFIYSFHVMHSPIVTATFSLICALRNCESEIQDVFNIYWKCTIVRVLFLKLNLSKKVMEMFRLSIIEMFYYKSSLNIRCTWFIKKFLWRTTDNWTGDILKQLFSNLNWDFYEQSCAFVVRF